MKNIFTRIAVRFVAWLSSFVPLEMLGQLFARLADRLDNYRQANGGMTPRPIFKQSVELGLSYACLELVVWVRGDDDDGMKGVMLKKRDANDQGWEGLKHINGAALRPFDTLDDLQKRVVKEITDDAGLTKKLLESFKERPYVDVFREDPDRRVNCLTPVYEACILYEDQAKLKPGFVLVPLKKLDDPSIFDHHRDVLRELMNK